MIAETMQEADLSSTTPTQSETPIDSQKQVGRFSRIFRAAIAGILISVASGIQKGEAGEPVSTTAVPIVDTKIGSVLVVGGGPLPKEVQDRFYELAGEDKGNYIVIPTASIDADNETLPISHFWSETRALTSRLLHTRDRKKADQPEFGAALRHATGVWIVGGKQRRLSEAYSGTNFETELRLLLQRGGVIGGTSAGAAIMPRVAILDQDDQGNAVTGNGLGIFGDDTMIEQHFNRGKGRADRFLNVLNSNRGRKGFAINESTALEVGPDGMRVHGASNVYYWPPSTEYSMDGASIFKAGDPITIGMPEEMLTKVEKQ